MFDSHSQGGLMNLLQENVLHMAHNLYAQYFNDKLTALLRTKMAHRRQIKQRSKYILHFGSSYKSKIPPPQSIQSTPETLAHSSEELSAPKPFVAELSNIELIGPDGISILPDHRYILENSVGKPDVMTDSVMRTIIAGLIPARLPTSTVVDDPIVSFSGIQSQAYFHWFADYLPRMRGVEHYTDTTGNRPRILIPRDPPKWLVKSLQIIGLPGSRVQNWHAGRIRANKLIIPSIIRDVYPSADAHVPSIRGLRWVGNRMKKSVEIDEDMPSNIWISREDADSRRITNKHEINDIIDTNGFETVKLSQWRLRDQIKLFSQAEKIASPHGAGLINTIFSENTQILELFGSFVTPLYYQICSGLGHDYHFLLCDGVPIEGVNKQKQSARDGEDIYVNPSLLKRAIKKL